MKSFLLSANGRLNRAAFWSALIYYLGASVVVSILCVALWQVMPGTVSDDGTHQVTGVAALPYVALILGLSAFLIWSGICIGVKRYHDRDKSGVWVLIQLVPMIGPLWYFIEAGCLAGTPGENRFGPDPLRRGG